MAPTVTTTLSGREETLINGRKYPVFSDNNGKKYVVIDGKRVNIKDPLFKAKADNAYNWEKLDESFEEQKSSHKSWKEHWLSQQGKAGEIYESAISAYKNAKKQYEEILSSAGCEFKELQGSAKQEAEEYHSAMTSASAQKRRAISDSIFYGRLAVDETFAMNDVTNLQAVAAKMSEG